MDRDQYYSAGTSFGALFAYYSAAVVDRFRAILPWYGMFYLHTEKYAKSTSIFHFQGLKDEEIPPGGGESGDGYLYPEMNHALTRYANRYGCGARVNISTPFDGRGTLVGCEEWPRCHDGLRVVRCNWDEAHGFWPSYAEEMMFWFIKSIAPNSVVDSVVV